MIYLIDRKNKQKEKEMKPSLKEVTVKLVSIEKLVRECQKENPISDIDFLNEFIFNNLELELEFDICQVEEDHADQIGELVWNLTETLDLEFNV